MLASKSDHSLVKTSKENYSCNDDGIKQHSHRRQNVLLQTAKFGATLLVFTSMIGVAAGFTVSSSPKSTTTSYRRPHYQPFSTSALPIEQVTNKLHTSIMSQTSFHRLSPSPSSLYMSPAIGKSGARIIESDENFLEITSNTSPSDLPILLFFTAPWCGPCRLSNPVVKEVMKQFTGEIDVLEVCTDDLPDVASDAGVVSIPTIQIYHGGKCMDTIVGCVAKNVLANAVQKVLDDIGEKSS